MSALQLTEHFETPLIVQPMPITADLNVELKQAVLQRRTADPKGVRISNRQGWHSDTRMLEWGGPAAMALVQQIVQLADRYSVDIAAEGRQRYAWVPEMWANVSAQGGSNQFHCHPGAFWAAVFYVDDGYAGSRDRALGGELELEDPRMPMVLMDGPDLRFRAAPDAPVASTEVLIRPVTGHLLLFPAWLRHGVLPYLGRGERISIAVNLTAVPVGE